MGQGVPSASLITENRVEQLRHQRAMLPSSGRSTTWRQGLMGTSTSTRERAQSCTCGRIKKILHAAGHAGGQLARKQLSRKGFGHEATLSLLSRKAERAGRVELGDLHPWRYPKAMWTSPGKCALDDPAWAGAVGHKNLLRCLQTSTILCFSISFKVLEIRCAMDKHTLNTCVTFSLLFPGKGTLEKGDHQGKCECV